MGRARRGCGGRAARVSGRVAAGLAALGRRVAGDGLLMGLLAALPVLLWLVPRPPAAVLGLIDTATIAGLAGLMAASRAVEASGMLDAAGRWLAGRVRGVRGLAFALCGFAAALSAVVTNDVALFITVPLTLALARGAEWAIPVARLVVFQALAVNVGSAASPIGNPQNLFLWQMSGVGPGAFALAMAPLVAGLAACLAGLIVLAFPARALPVLAVAQGARADRALGGAALAGYPVMLAALAWGQPEAAALALIVALAVWRRGVLAGVDWMLLVVFALMFVNLGLLAQVPAMAGAAARAQDLPGGMTLVAALLSQGMSNVPAAIFLAGFGADWLAVGWGASVGGFGLAIGSLANLIALRLAPVPGIWRSFHAWSGAMFVLALAWALWAGLWGAR